MIMKQNIENNHEYVDLGLSVKWATCNVGASSPEEYGDYFAWGETEPKDIYNFDTYKWYQLNNETKRFMIGKYNDKDNKMILDSEDDVAHVKWGGSWHIPTYNEWIELTTKCTFEVETINGVSGYNVTSKINGNKIFLPFSGSKQYDSVQYKDKYGSYWINKAYYEPDYSESFDFNKSIIEIYMTPRYTGLSVRPVCE